MPTIAAKVRPRPLVAAPVTVNTAKTTTSESRQGCWGSTLRWSYDLGMALATTSSTIVPGGHLQYRHRLRRLGPLMGLAVPVGAFGVGALLLAAGGSAVRGSSGFLLTAMAAPTMLLLGAPVAGGTARYSIAAATSLLLWLAIGSWAAHRATHRVVASWRDWWREYAWLAVPVWLGATVAFGVAYKTVL